MKKVCVLTLFLLSFNANSTMTSNELDCPEQFEGRIKTIIAPVGSEELFSVEKVIWENRRTLKGNVDDEVTLELLQNGPFKLEKEKDYRVHLRKSKLCWVEEI